MGLVAFGLPSVGSLKLRESESDPVSHIGCDCAESRQHRLEWLHVRHKNSNTCHAAGRASYQISKQLSEPTL